MAESLAEAFTREQARNRDLLAEYQALPPESGWFGVTMLKDLLARAERVALRGDVVQMLSVYEELKGSR